MSVDLTGPASVWIVHRESRARSALARIAAAGENTVLGGPGDRIFESAGAPGGVVLGLGDDFERELEFAHRMAARFASCSWILTPEHADVAEADLGQGMDWYKETSSTMWEKLNEALKPVNEEFNRQMKEEYLYAPPAVRAKLKKAAARGKRKNRD